MHIEWIIIISLGVLAWGIVIVWGIIDCEHK